MVQEQSKIAVVTGANQGIGFELSRGLGKAGFKIVMACRRPAEGEKAAATLKEEGIDAQFIKLDISDTDSILNFAE